jgi:hypothetical protein
MLPAQIMRSRCVMSVNCSAAVSSRTNAGADVAAVCRDQGRRRDFPDVREHVIVERRGPRVALQGAPTSTVSCRLARASPRATLHEDGAQRTDRAMGGTTRV